MRALCRDKDICCELIKTREVGRMNQFDDAEVISFSGQDDQYVWMSEKAEKRACRVLTGILALITLPVYILAFMA